MLTWQFDPATGDAYQVSNGGQSLEDPSAPTQAEVEEFHIKQSAQDYARRKTIESAPQINTDNLEAELKLADVQQKLFAGGLTPIEQIQLERLADQLAASLVGAPAPAAQAAEEDNFQSVEDYQNELAGDPSVQAALENAGEVFSEEVNLSINEALSEADELQTQSGIGALQQLQANPDWVNTTDEVGAFTSYETNQITELVGAELGDKITTINAALASGAVDKGRAMRTVMADPALLTAMLQCSQAGIFKLAL